MEDIASKFRQNPPSEDQAQVLSGKVAVVTGSNSGIGAAIAKELSYRGASVVLNYPTSDFKEAADAVGATLKTEWIATESDLSTDSGPSHLIDSAVARFGKVDILVNNAAVATLAKFEETNLEAWDKAMSTNVRGPFLTTQAAIKHFPAKGSAGGGGRIINITSAVGTAPELLQTAYATSKGALATLTRCMAKDLPPVYGCTVNAVSPGITKTQQFLRELQRTGGAAYTYVFDARTPVDGWIGLPEDVALAVAFLAEERASWINGASINVSGGMFLD